MLTPIFPNVRGSTILLTLRGNITGKSRQHGWRQQRQSVVRGERLKDRARIGDLAGAVAPS